MFAFRFFAVLSLLGCVVALRAEALDDRTITINSSADVIARRAALINYIWGTPGFPSATLPTRIANIASPIAALANVQRVDELRADMEGGEFSIGYHFIAANPNGRLVVVENGHSCAFDDESAPAGGGPPPYQTPGHEAEATGLRRTVTELLAEGFSVLAVFMPRYTPTNCAPNGIDTHKGIFQIPVASGHALKFFLEPTAVFLNYLKQRSASDQFPIYAEYNMVGLSGGGWTTTMYAAIDPTIVASYPVAGSLPLYLSWNGSIGDEEQHDSGTYAIAGYPDLYVMGSIGTGRRQVQILNRQDNCCFGETQHEVLLASATYDQALRDYELRVRAAVKALGSGSFRLEIDEAATSHMISWNVAVNVIIADLNGEHRSVGAGAADSAFVRGMNGLLWHYQGGGWTNTGLAAVSAPAVLEGVVHEFDLFYRSPSNGIKHAFRINGTWLEESLSGVIITDPVAVSISSGRYDVIALGKGYTPFHWSSVSGSAFTRVSETHFLGPPAVVSRDATHLEIFARDAQRALHHVAYDVNAGADSGVDTVVGGIMRGFPDAAGGTPLRAYVRGQNNTLFEAAEVSGGWQWSSIASATGTASIEFSGSPEILVDSGTVCIFLRHQDHSVHKFTKGTSWLHESLGGQIADTPQATSITLFGKGLAPSLQQYVAPAWQTINALFD